MAELTAEQAGESGAGGETQRVLLTPFLTKTYQLVDDSQVDDLISWNEDGTGFIVWKPAEFARDLLPKYFKHNNLSSFVRQLNTYGFRKVVPDRWEFANDLFKKGEKGLLQDIQRRKMTQLGSVALATPAAEGPSTVQVTQSSPPKSGDEQMVLSSSLGGSKQPQATDSTVPAAEKGGGGNVEGTSKSTSPELRRENQRLEKENQDMKDELSHLKGLCNNIFSLMSNYGPSGQQDPGNVSMESKQLDLLQSGRYLEEQAGSSGGGVYALDDDKEGDGDRSPKLFGVSIGAKRRKISNEEESSHMQQQQQRQQEDEAQTENYSYNNTA